MLKKMRSIIAVVLVICLLPIYPARADETGDTADNVSSQSFEGISKLAYERSDSSVINELKEILLKDVKIAGNMDQVSREWRVLTDKVNYYSEMGCLIDLYCYQSATDENLAEKEANAAEYNKIVLMYCEAITTVYDSEYKSLVEDEFGELASRYVDYARENADEALLPLKEEREALISEYMSMVERYYTEAEAAELMLKLINVNQEIAAVLGYDNYLDYAYKNIFFRDYTYERTLEVLEGFRTAFAPFAGMGSIYKSGALVRYTNEKLDANGAIELIAEVAKENSEEFKESMNYLQDKEALTWIDSNSITSYVDYFHYHKSPYVAINKRNTGLDVLDVFAHEYGHFNNAYWHPAQYDGVFTELSLVDYDVVEVPSTANEYIMMRNCEDFFGQYADAAANNTLGSSIDNTYYAACVAEIETVAYTEEFSGPEELAERLDSITEKYYGYSQDVWSRYSHIFEMPGYLISYVMAGLSSWEIAELYNEDPEKGLEAYNRVGENVNLHYDECMKASGLTSEWTAENLEELSAKLVEMYRDDENPEFVNTTNNAVYLGGHLMEIFDSTLAGGVVKCGDYMENVRNNQIYFMPADNTYVVFVTDVFGNIASIKLSVAEIPFIPVITSKKNSQTLTWTSVEGAESYKIYGAKAGNSFEYLGTVYDSEGVQQEYALKSFSFVNKEAASGTWKYYIKAYGEDENGEYGVLGRSMTSYAAVKKNTKYTNAESVTFKNERITIENGKTVKQAAKIVSVDDAKKLANGNQIRKLTYISSNTEVARVNEKGKITAVGEGECFIYAIAANGESDVLAVEVK